MAQLRQGYAEIVERGAQVVVVGPEKREAFARYWEKEDLPFVGIPDPKHRILDAYGQEFRLLKLGRMPAMAMVDTAGIIRFAHYGSSMADIPTNGETLDALDAIG